MAAVAVKRSVQPAGDLLTVVAPDYRLVVRVPHAGGPARVLSLQRGDMLSPESMQAVEHQRRDVKRQAFAWLRSAFLPRIIRLCPNCGGTAREEVRVTLPQMIEHRAAACGSCEHRRGWFCGQCRCLLWLKQRIAGSDCPAGKWIATAARAA